MTDLIFVSCLLLIFRFDIFLSFSADTYEDTSEKMGKASIA